MKIKVHPGCGTTSIGSIPIITTALTKALKSNFLDE